jgi:phosphoribosylaminoimidazole-succinocarboxamide synthase
MVNESHIETMGWAESNDIATMKQLTLKVNDLLTALFQKAGICLVDYKLEFGKDNNGMLVLGDEFTPDGCRLWDIETWEVMDKDRFRQDMNDVIGHYIKIAQRLGISGF